MPTISGTTTILTTVTNTNVLLGSQYELAPFDGTMIIGMKADRASVTCNILAGPDTLQEPGGFVPQSATAGTAQAPAYPDDYHWEDTVAHGDRLKIAITNGNAATTVVIWALRLTPTTA